jgi:hypothetical protein
VAPVFNQVARTPALWHPYYRWCRVWEAEVEVVVAKYKNLFRAVVRDDENVEGYYFDPQ